MVRHKRGVRIEQTEKGEWITKKGAKHHRVFDTRSKIKKTTEEA